MRAGDPVDAGNRMHQVFDGRRIKRLILAQNSPCAKDALVEERVPHRQNPPLFQEPAKIGGITRHLPSSASASRSQPSAPCTLCLNGETVLGNTPHVQQEERWAWCLE